MASVNLSAEGSKFTKLSGLYDLKKELEEKQSDVDKEIHRMESSDPELERFAKEFLRKKKSDPQSPASGVKRKREQGEEDERVKAEREARRHQLGDWNKMVQKHKAGKKLSPEELNRGVSGGLENGREIPQDLLVEWIGGDEEKRKKVEAAKYAGGLSAMETK